MALLECAARPLERNRTQQDRIADAFMGRLFCVLAFGVGYRSRSRLLRFKACERRSLPNGQTLGRYPSGAMLGLPVRVFVVRLRSRFRSWD